MWELRGKPAVILHITINFVHVGLLWWGIVIWWPHIPIVTVGISHITYYGDLRLDWGDERRINNVITMLQCWNLGKVNTCNNNLFSSCCVKRPRSLPLERRLDELAGVVFPFLYVELYRNGKEGVWLCSFCRNISLSPSSSISTPQTHKRRERCDWSISITSGPYNNIGCL